MLSKGPGSFPPQQLNLALLSMWHWVWRHEYLKSHNVIVSSWFQRAAAVRKPVAREYLNGSCCFCIKLWKWTWGCSRVSKMLEAVRLLLRRAASREWNQPERERGGGGDRGRGGGRGGGEKERTVAGFGVCPAGLWSSFGRAVPHHALTIPLWNNVYSVPL